MNVGRRLVLLCSVSVPAEGEHPEEQEGDVQGTPRRLGLWSITSSEKRKIESRVVGDPRTMMKTMMMMNVQEKEALVSTGDGIHTSDQGQEFVTVSLSFSLHFHSIYSCIVSSILFVVLFFLGCASDAPHPHPNVEHGESRSASSSDGGAYCVVNGKWRKRSRIDAFPKRFLTLSM